ncbi:MAG: hypothetical protein ACPGEF_07665, partial [Endozoicomonas sp.]
MDGPSANKNSLPSIVPELNNQGKPTPSVDQGGKNIVPVDPENLMLTMPAEQQQPQNNPRAIKTADQPPQEAESSPEAVAEIQNIIKTGGPLAQKYRRLVEQNSVSHSCIILQELQNEENTWEKWDKNPEKAMMNLAKKINSFTKYTPSLKIVINTKDFESIQLIPVNPDQLQNLSGDTVRQLMEAALVLAKGMQSKIQLEKIETENSELDISTLEQKIQAKMSDLIPEDQQKIIEQLKTVKNPIIHITIRGDELWPDIKQNIPKPLSSSPKAESTAPMESKSIHGIPIKPHP